MDIRASSSAKRVRCTGFGGFLAVRALDVRIVGLAGDFGDVVGFEGV